MPVEGANGGPIQSVGVRERRQMVVSQRWSVTTISESVAAE